MKNSDDISRKDFLKNSALAMAGIAFASNTLMANPHSVSPVISGKGNLRLKMSVWKPVLNMTKEKSFPQKQICFTLKLKTGKF